MCSFAVITAFTAKSNIFINEHKILVVSSDFGADVSVTVRLRTEDVSAFEEDMVELTSARAKTEVISRGWNEM